MFNEKKNIQHHSVLSMNKSVENLLISSHEVIGTINTSSMGGLRTSEKSRNELAMENSCNSAIVDGQDRRGVERSSSLSPLLSSKAQNKSERTTMNSDSGSSVVRETGSPEKKADKDAINRSSDSAEPNKNSVSEGKKGHRSDRAKKKSSWYNVLYPTYKSRSEDFKRIFKDVPDDERLIVDYTCVLQREIMVQGRLYVSQNYVCFYANLFSWETLVSLRWKDVASITKEKTALVIPNAILICTETDKFLISTFSSREKTYLMLFRVWQNALIGQPMSTSEMWGIVHTGYGDELGLTSDDEDYVPPLSLTDEKLPTRSSVESFSEVESPPTSPVTPITTVLETTDPGLQLQVAARTDVTLDQSELSDTTESDADKPAMRAGPRVTTVCTALHEGRQLVKATFPIHIDQLFTLLFTNSKFFLDFHTARKTTDLVQSAWTQDSVTGKKTRIVSLTVALSQAVGPRSSQVVETQTMLPCSRPGYRYSIDVDTTNAGIPYADSFSVSAHYCLSSSSEGETSFSVYCELKFKKHVWSVMKGLIERNCWAGLEDYFSSLEKALNVECESCGTTVGVKRKTRRRRRVTGPSVTLPSHSPENLPSNVPSPAIEPPCTRHIDVTATRGDTGTVISWVLLVAVLFLTLINGLLYYKLWGLEDAAAYTIMDLHVLRNTPKSDEDWINLLQQQESLHNVEMRKWQRVLHTAAQLLSQTEESLMELQTSMHPTATEKIFSVLKPTMKNFDDRRKLPNE